VSQIVAILELFGTRRILSSFHKPVQKHRFPPAAVRTTAMNRKHFLHPCESSYHDTRGSTVLFLETTGRRGTLRFGRMTRPQHARLRSWSACGTRRRTCGAMAWKESGIPRDAAFAHGRESEHGHAKTGGSRGRSPSRLTSLS